MGYSLRQPSNEGNACYDGFLGHPRKRGEHAACTPFQMHPPPEGTLTPTFAEGTPLIRGNTKWTPAHLPRWDHPLIEGKIAQGTKHPGGIP